MEIVDLCLAIDTVARDAYTELAATADSDELRDFWRHMADEEETHVDYWQRLKATAETSPLPKVFDDPAQVRDELAKSLSQAKRLLLRCREAPGVQNAFLLAYRLEFYMLHPAFEMMFHGLKSAQEGANPESDYESHLSSFVDMLARHGDVTPELELLGEILQRLWAENKVLARQASRDSLTDVFNRRGFQTVATQVGSIASRKRWKVGVLALDIDDFKQINDRRGHFAGDDVLKAVSDILVTRLRASDLIARFGGDEFIALLPETDGAAAAAIAEEVRQRIEEAEIDGGSAVTVSIGVASGPIGDDVRDELDGLIRRADANMYRAKQSGKNRVHAGADTSPPTG
jgi:diguanylate cyclase (GGDEF)-like protein